MGRRHCVIPHSHNDFPTRRAQHRVVGHHLAAVQRRRRRAQLRAGSPQLVERSDFRLVQKLLPAVSQTEQEVLEAGTVWWDGELFSGKPNIGKNYSPIRSRC